MDGGGRSDLAGRVDRANEFGMAHAVWADLRPHKVAVYEPGGRTRTFGELNANANRIARLLRGRGCRLVAPPESFLVSGKNTLLQGEAARARSWGALIGETASAARPATAPRARP